VGDGLSEGTRVLITDGQDRAALAVCRALGDAGYVIDVAAGERPAPAHWSRWCHRRLTVTDPTDDAGRFVEELRAIVSGTRYELAIVGRDASLLAVSRHRDRLAPFVELGLPSSDVVERCLSKVGLAEAAEAVGLGSPGTAICDDGGEAEAAARRFGYPVLVKPRSSVFEVDGGLRHRGSSLVDSEAGLLEVIPEYGTPCLVQRQLRGPIVSFSGVAADGRLLAEAVSRYSRTWPPQAGSVSFSETIPAPADLVSKVGSLIARLGWEGIFELELIRMQDGRFAAIDLNPRPYGSLELATRAGVPLPVIWCDWLRGTRTGRPGEARPGYRYRWDDAELRNLWWRLRRADLRAALEVLRPRRRTVRAHFRLSDPAPLAARGLLLLNHGLDRLRRDDRREQRLMKGAGDES
jgi:predicted ATP-grasp superfamily ATP-dependent carboligase